MIISSNIYSVVRTEDRSIPFQYLEKNLLQKFELISILFKCRFYCIAGSK
jgi:hypothetical protein